ncbi:MAG: hypothetical protein ACYSTY_06495 [Planctomycetota bacterium]
MTRQAIGFVVSAAAAVGVLWAADLVLQPVPMPAGLAALGGYLAIWFARSRTWMWSVIGVGIGIAAGLGVHAWRHLDAQSPDPQEGLAVHLLIDGLEGFAVAAVVLGVIAPIKVAFGRRVPPAAG